MRVRTIGFVILALLCTISCARQPQRSAEKPLVYKGEGVPEWFTNDTLRATFHYTEAVKFAALEDKEKAVSHLNKVLEIDPRHPSAHNRLGQFLIEDKELEKALYHTTLATESDSLNNDFLEDYGRVLSLLGKYEKARGVYRQLIVREPQEPNHYRLAAILYASTGMPHMAISILDSADYKLGYYEPLAEMKRGLLLDVGLYGRAIKEAQTMVANDPQNVERHIELGDIYVGLGQDSLAEVSYREALKVAPESARTLFHLSDFYYQRSMEQEFLGVIQRIFRLGDVDVDMKLDIYDKFVVSDEGFYRRNFFSINTIASILHVKYPHNEKVEMRYAYHQIRAGELDKALDTFKRLSRNPNTQEPKEALLTVMSIEEHLGHTDSVRLYLDLAIERLPNDSELYIRKAYLLREQGEGEELINSYFEKAIEVATDDMTRSDAYTALADNTSDIKKSKKLYKKALEYNPNNAMAMNNWAYFSSLAGVDLHQALELSTRACELEATNATYLDTKAWVLYLLGRNLEAKKVMQQAISLDNTYSPTLLLHYADILAANREIFLAEIYYKRAAEAGADELVIRERLENLKKPK